MNSFRIVSMWNAIEMQNVENFPYILDSEHLIWIQEFLLAIECPKWHLGGSEKTVKNDQSYTIHINAANLS